MAAKSENWCSLNRQADGWINRMAGGKRAVAAQGAKGGKNPASLHQRILAELEGRIFSGAWAPGARIPFEIELAEEFGCSRMTMHKVLSRLVETGLIERRRKAGSFVRLARGQSAVLSIQGVREEVAGLGLSYRYELTSRVRRKAGAEARRRLDLAAGAAVLAVECRHFAGDQPFCIEKRLINLQAVPAAAGENFADIAPGAWLLERVPWSTAEHVIRAIAADAATAAALEIPEGSACLVIERQTRANDRAITQVTLTYPGARHALSARFSPLE